MCVQRLSLLPPPPLPRRDAGFSEGEGSTTISAARGAATVIDLSLGGSAKTTN